jgi:hypothetical protein
LRDDGVPESSKSVHPVGNPMSHSTHVGFSDPPLVSCRRFRHATPRDCIDGHIWFALVVGVGHMRPSGLVRNVARSAGFTARDRLADGHFVPSLAIGVGHNPDSLSAVRGTNG